MVHVALAAGPGEDLDFRGQGVEKVGDSSAAASTSSRAVELRILSSDADRATASVAVVARVGGGPDLLVIFDIDRLVAVQRDQKGGAQVAGVAPGQVPWRSQSRG